MVQMAIKVATGKSGVTDSREGGSSKQEVKKERKDKRSAGTRYAVPLTMIIMGAFCTFLIINGKTETLEEATKLQKLRRQEL
jgi:hypothetical protein